MTEQPPDAEADRRHEPEPVRPAASTELVLSGRRPALPVRQRATAAVGELRQRLPELRRQLPQLRHRLPELRHHPAVVASVSAAATVGSALLVNGLREALRHAEVAEPSSTTSTVIGYIVHEVHVIHHFGRDPRDLVP